MRECMQFIDLYEVYYDLCIIEGGVMVVGRANLFEISLLLSFLWCYTDITNVNPTIPYTRFYKAKKSKTDAISLLEIISDKFNNN